MASREVPQERLKHRFGRANPERMQLEYWEWMVRTGLSASEGRASLDRSGNRIDLSRKTACDGSPDWCFKRFGRTRTRMPDGRIICIGGEHEDSYDEDFCIYNDVVVLRPEAGDAGVTPDRGRVEIYGYPRAVFPPTDFHNAALVGDRIYIIGCLGHEEQRKPGVTPVYALDTHTYQIQAIPASGRSPGWISGHSAWYDAEHNSIVVRGGEIQSGSDGHLSPHVAAHRLRLDNLRWELIAERERHRKFSLVNARRLCSDPPPEALRPASVPHEWVELDASDHSDCQFIVAGVRITIRQRGWGYSALVEGELAADVVDRVLSEIASNLEQSTECAWRVTERANSKADDSK